MLTTTIKLKSRPEKRKEIAQTVAELVRQIVKNTKCRKVNTYRNSCDEDTFIVVKEWSSQHDWDDYMSSRLYSVLLGVDSLLAYPLEIELVLGTKDPPK